MNLTMTTLENAFKMLAVEFMKAGFNREDAITLAGESLKNGEFEKMIKEALLTM